MARTLRTPIPGSKASPAQYGARKADLLNRGIKTHGSTRCLDAKLDGEGNAKLNTWDETKGDGRTAKRQIRRAGKLQIKRQLEA